MLKAVTGPDDFDEHVNWGQLSRQSDHAAAYCDDSERSAFGQRVIEGRAGLSQRDALTGLPSRPALSAHLDSRMAAFKRPGATAFHLLRLNIDEFRLINDEYGHAFGDTVLAAVALRLAELAGAGFLARLGGAEFILVASPALGDASALARQVCAAFDHDLSCAGRRLRITISIGGASYPRDGEDEVRLLAAANVALRRAKSSGPGSFFLFDRDELARECERLAFRRNLREAIDGGAIDVHYQPLFHADGSVEGFEALARWWDPLRGVVSPAAFIAEAEAGGLIAMLDALVLRAACREAASWQKLLRISVNVSAIEFEKGDLVSRVRDVLAETGLAPERLELEITEGIMVGDADQVMDILAQLRELGVRIALDDFGTGYSSLSYLHRFPLTTLKIDRSFVAKLGVARESVAITRAVIQLGHALGMQVVAEGVETSEQLDFLIQEGCDLMQGYLLGRPLDAAAYARLTGSAATSARR